MEQSLKEKRIRVLINTIEKETEKMESLKDERSFWILKYNLLKEGITEILDKGECFTIEKGDAKYCLECQDTDEQKR